MFIEIDNCLINKEAIVSVSYCQHFDETGSVVLALTTGVRYEIFKSRDKEKALKKYEEIKRKLTNEIGKKETRSYANRRI